VSLAPPAVRATVTASALFRLTQINCLRTYSRHWSIVRAATPMFGTHRERIMSKGMDRKKDTKKKPAKSLQEKRAAKKEKKANKGFHV
jgi:hypothetical protein